MSPSGLVPRFSPEFRTTLFYFSYFLGSGASVVFLPIWLDEKGITADQIGLLNALPILAILILNTFVGRLADKASDWRQVIVIGALISGIIPIGLFFVNDFYGILLVWTLATLPGGAIGPVIDAAAMRMTRRNGTDFGTIRAWGTVGYMLINALTGFLVVWFGSQIFVPLFVGLMLLRAATSLLLPRFRAPAEQLTVSAVAPAAGNLRAALKLWFVLPLIGFAMVSGTHFILNAFAALLWKQQGIGEEIIGPLIALGAFAEAAMMFFWKKLSGRFRARHLIMASALMSVARWTIMAFQPPLGVLILLQLTHAITFALGYLGCVHFIANWTSEDIAAEAQSMFSILQQVMSVIALIVFGWLVATMGEKAYLVAAAFALLGGGLIWVSLRLKPPQSELAAAAR